MAASQVSPLSRLRGRVREGAAPFRHSRPFSRHSREGGNLAPRPLILSLSKASNGQEHSPHMERTDG